MNVSPPESVAGSRCLPLHSSRTRRLRPPRCSPAPFSSACSRREPLVGHRAEPLVGRGHHLAQPLGEDVRREPHLAAGCRRSCPRPARPDRPSGHALLRTGAHAARASVQLVGQGVQPAGAQGGLLVRRVHLVAQATRLGEPRPASATRSGGSSAEGRAHLLLGQDGLGGRTRRAALARAAECAATASPPGSTAASASAREAKPASAAAASAAAAAAGELVGGSFARGEGRARLIEPVDRSSVGLDERRRPTGRPAGQRAGPRARRRAGHGAARPRTARGCVRSQRHPRRGERRWRPPSPRARSRPARRGTGRIALRCRCSPARRAAAPLAVLRQCVTAWPPLRDAGAPWSRVARVVTAPAPPGARSRRSRSARERPPRPRGRRTLMPWRERGARRSRRPGRSSRRRAPRRARPPSRRFVARAGRGRPAEGPGRGPWCRPAAHAHRSARWSAPRPRRPPREPARPDSSALRSAAARWASALGAVECRCGVGSCGARARRRVRWRSDLGRQPGGLGGRGPRAACARRAAGARAAATTRRPLVPRRPSWRPAASVSRSMSSASMPSTCADGVDVAATPGLLGLGVLGLGRLHAHGLRKHGRGSAVGVEGRGKRLLLVGGGIESGQLPVRRLAARTGIGNGAGRGRGPPAQRVTAAVAAVERALRWLGELRGRLCQAAQPPNARGSRPRPTVSSACRSHASGSADARRPPGAG